MAACFTDKRLHEPLPAHQCNHVARVRDSLCTISLSTVAEMISGCAHISIALREYMEKVESLLGHLQCATPRAPAPKPQPAAHDSDLQMPYCIHLVLNQVTHCDVLYKEKSSITPKGNACSTAGACIAHEGCTKAPWEAHLGTLAGCLH